MLSDREYADSSNNSHPKCPRCESPHTDYDAYHEVWSCNHCRFEWREITTVLGYEALSP